jgi:hypothetical protein
VTLIGTGARGANLVGSGPSAVGRELRLASGDWEEFTVRCMLL